VVASTHDDARYYDQRDSGALISVVCCGLKAAADLQLSGALHSEAVYSPQTGRGAQRTDAFVHVREIRIIVNI
jgi:hypothetical protein